MQVRRIRVPPTLTAEAIDAFAAAFHAALDSAEDRVIVLHGDGETFCLGADLEGLLDAGDGRAQAQAFADLLDALMHSSKPVIAEVSGRAAAGGLGLVAGADLVIASDAAGFALTELLFGAVPAIVVPVLLRRMSEARVMLWAISAQTWNASEAAAAGLVDLCVPAQALDQTTAEWGRRLQRADPGALVALRRHVSRAASLTPSDGVDTILERFSDPEVLRRVRAFVEHGDAPWLKAD